MCCHCLPSSKLFQKGYLDKLMFATTCVWWWWCEFNHQNKPLFFCHFSKMSEEEVVEVTASFFTARSQRNVKRMRDDENKKEKEAVTRFISLLKDRALLASGNGKFDCEVTFSGEHTSAITAAVAVIGFTTHWDVCDGDSFCVVSWKK